MQNFLEKETTMPRNAGKTTHTGQEARAAGSEEAAVRTKTKEGVEGEAKDARSITSGDDRKSAN
uniref:Uncharacterized protein n=1 Tax=Oryza sativa subsp. japonica TaxID=39947 RepID=Q69IV4_ORYSJ|nr:hypothetical protein [Oryza sativa Japonica Group]